MRNHAQSVADNGRCPQLCDLYYIEARLYKVERISTAASIADTSRAQRDKEVFASPLNPSGRVSRKAYWALQAKGGLLVV